MRILVTGGAGFIGSHVVELLLAEGHHVAVVDCFWEHGGGRLENIDPRARLHRVDIRDTALAAVFDAEQPEVVCHLAAQHSVGISTQNPSYDADVNILGLINVLENATRCGVRKVVFSSSAAIYGSAETMPIIESSPKAPLSPYAITKLSAEHYLAYWQENFGLAYTALRYGNVYGPRQDPAGEAGVIAIFLDKILAEEGVRIDWDGEQQRDFVFVEDVARANLLSLTAGDNEAYCIASGKGITINHLFDTICGAVGHKVPVTHAPKRAGDIYLSYFDPSKASAELGWQATVPLTTGLQKTTDFFRKKAVEAAA